MWDIDKDPFDVRLVEKSREKENISPRPLVKSSTYITSPNTKPSSNNYHMMEPPPQKKLKMDSPEG